MSIKISRSFLFAFLFELLCYPSGIVYNGMIFNYGYEDVDNDGKLEFYGITDNFVGAPTKSKTIFKINKDGLYIPWQEMTTKYL